MTQRIRAFISIIISAVMLGLVITYCIEWWMPTEVLDWIIWGAMVAVGITAIYRIVNLDKMLSDKESE
ncbi:MAG: hypothetical protein J6R16_00565 [Alistipes sp.]|nr:hypothetical protein [Alistipes sp.]